jgi:hypothetical protein
LRELTRAALREADLNDIVKVALTSPEWLSREQAEDVLVARKDEMLLLHEFPHDFDGALVRRLTRTNHIHHQQMLVEHLIQGRHKGSLALALCELAKCDPEHAAMLMHLMLSSANAVDKYGADTAHALLELNRGHALFFWALGPSRPGEVDEPSEPHGVKRVGAQHEALAAAIIRVAVAHAREGRPALAEQALHSLCHLAVPPTFYGTLNSLMNDPQWTQTTREQVKKLQVAAKNRATRPTRAALLACVFALTYWPGINKLRE